MRIEELVASKGIAEAAAEELEQRVVAAEAAAREAEARAAATKATVVEKIVEKEVACTKCPSLEARIKSLEADKVALRSELTQATEELERKGTEVEALRGQVAGLEGELALQTRVQVVEQVQIQRPEEPKEPEEPPPLIPEVGQSPPRGLTPEPGFAPTQGVPMADKEVQCILLKPGPPNVAVDLSYPELEPYREPDGSWQTPAWPRQAPRQMFGRSAYISKVEVDTETGRIIAAAESGGGDKENREDGVALAPLSRWLSLFAQLARTAANRDTHSNSQRRLQAVRASRRVGPRLVQSAKLVSQRQQAQREMRFSKRAAHLRKCFTARDAVDPSQGPLKPELPPKAKRPQTARPIRHGAGGRHGRVSSRSEQEEAGSLSEQPGGATMAFRKEGEGLRKGGPVYCLNPSIVNRYMPTRETVKEVSGFKPSVAAPPRVEFEPAGKQNSLNIKDFGAGLDPLAKPTSHQAPAPSARVQRSKSKVKRRPATAGSVRQTEPRLMELTPGVTPGELHPTGHAPTGSTCSAGVFKMGN